MDLSTKDRNVEKVCCNALSRVLFLPSLACVPASAFSKRHDYRNFESTEVRTQLMKGPVTCPNSSAMPATTPNHMRPRLVLTPVTFVLLASTAAIRLRYLFVKKRQRPRLWSKILIATALVKAWSLWRTVWRLVDLHDHGVLGSMRYIKKAAESQAINILCVVS